jgi:hypothetical protein
MTYSGSVLQSELDTVRQRILSPRERATGPQPIADVPRAPTARTSALLHIVNPDPDDDGSLRSQTLRSHAVTAAATCQDPRDHPLGRRSLGPPRCSFHEQEPQTGQVVLLEEFQIPFASWLRDFREGLPRDTSLVLAGGERRGGKTIDLQICANAAAIDVPRCISWLVTKSFLERDKLDEMFRDLIPSA